MARYVPNRHGNDKPRSGDRSEAYPFGQPGAHQRCRNHRAPDPPLAAGELADDERYPGVVAFILLLLVATVPRAKRLHESFTHDGYRDRLPSERNRNEQT
ncbi:MAG: hypothetical protein WC804_11760 [Sphingomonas sp.]|jgi:hypothetical protein|uniref:hypothetical protein n=1 Tax=Sphingomonas sp. TaxID=28214 RepID=UPI0035671843